jgi:hypothetical protein
MKKFSKKGVLLFAAAMALCAFVMPSMASAASWGVIGTEHTLTSPDIGFINDGAGVTSMCTNASFTIDVSTAAALEITNGSFTGCTASGASIGACTATSTGTNFPWTATAVTTSNIQIHGVNINVFFEGAGCGAAGQTLRITGTLTRGEWNGNGTNQHEVLLTPGATGANGLVSHSILGAGQPLTLTGTIRDNQQQLTVN